jgi:hypothetical protein
LFGGVFISAPSVPPVVIIQLPRTRLVANFQRLLSLLRTLLPAIAPSALFGCGSQFPLEKTHFRSFFGFPQPFLTSHSLAMFMASKAA